MENNFFTALDSHYFHHGTHYELYEKMGAHIVERNGVKGVNFTVWAPAAKAVCVVCDSNGWKPWVNDMQKLDGGVWELFIPNIGEGEKYKYHIVRADGSEVQKCDPYANRSELRPATASIVADLNKFEWTDAAWLKEKEEENFLEKPMAVYEVHLGSWKKDETKTDEHRFLDYKRLAHELCEYIKYMGYTHIELMGICEYPFDPSWGYQVTGYFAPTARYGSPEDFMYFVNYMHENGIGVILDWVPAHFPKDDYGLANFDGTPLYEFADPLRAEYPEWGTKAFDYGKKEVSNFLIASAFFWVKKYHIDALRADAVAATLFSNFGRTEWRPNKDGGEWNLEGFEFFRHLNSVLRQRTNAFIIAEDSSILEGVTAPAAKGGIGFGLKWNMGWMNDTLKYMKQDPVYRKYHHWLMTHTFEYIFDENYMLVLSHDEVVYGKGSMVNKFPGNMMDKFGSLKTCYTMMMGHPGKKLLFMGQDFAQVREWDFKSGLDWHLCDEEGHRDVMNCYRSLLHLYKERPVLYNDSCKNSFEWINSGDYNRSIFSFIRRNPWNYNNALVFVCNFTPVFRENFAVGVPVLGTYNRVFSTYPDERPYTVEAEERLCDGRPYCVPFNLRPFESMIFEVPFVESTEEEKKKEKTIKNRAKREHKLAKNDLSHVPEVTPPVGKVKITRKRIKK
ncbi:MAG: 1,4-alpha-glucan branching protein GlgB [Clostridia bacterium]|nr:1,4-alpha-glucan branching protein GlgB [Clostridia bacterium]